MSSIGIRGTQRWALGLLFSLAIGLARPAHAETAISPEARAYFKSGVELLKSDPPNYQDAYYQFKLAFEKSQSWKVLGNFGLCAVKLERDGEALKFYDEYLRRGGKQINREEREAIENDMSLIKGNGATVELSSEVVDLQIVDSRAGSSVPPQSYALSAGKATLLIRAGTHRLSASNADGRTVQWDVTLEPQQTARHVFDFSLPSPPIAKSVPKAAPRTTPVEISTPAAPTREPSSALRTAGYVTAGAGVLALGTSVVTGLMAKSKEKTAKSKCDSNSVCDPTAAPLFDSASSLARTTNILLIGGGVLASAGIAMVLFGGPERSPEQASELRLVPLFSSTAGGVVAVGRF